MNTKLIPPPKVRVLIAPGFGYALEGWQDFERWACANDNIFRTLKIRCVSEGVSEIEMLRLMVATMALDRFAYHETLLKYADSFGSLP